LFSAASAFCAESDGAAFRSNWGKKVERTWLGPEYWANPLQDWRLKDGRVECVGSGGDRNVFLLTRELTPGDGSFTVSVKLGALNPKAKSGKGWAGFKLGVRGQFGDYRDSAIRGRGLRAGITISGELFIGSLITTSKPVNVPLDDIRLVLKSSVDGDVCRMSLEAFDKKGAKLAETTRDVASKWVDGGGLALVCSANAIPKAWKPLSSVDFKMWPFPKSRTRGGDVGFWFADWAVSGDKLKAFPERTFGPILFTQYTLNDKTVKLTAQMAPMGEANDEFVLLRVKEGGKWATIAKSKIDPLARTARFRLKNWQAGEDVPYRIQYACQVSPGKKTVFHFDGIIRKEPWKKKEFVVAAFTGNNDFGYPPDGLVNRVAEINPDLLFFSGDQIYEPVGGYGIQKAPLDKAVLDYLHKWYIFGWAYKNLMRDRPTVCLADDHDVYHGNVWGDSGKHTAPGLNGAAEQDSGGYKMPPAWVNMIQRTQTSHMPDPYDPTPVEQKIGVYYCALDYAGVSFAIVEDRKFKSAPKKLLPDAEIWNGWAQNPKFNPKKDSDAQGAVLLGKRQLDFLEHWTSDWSHHAWMKVLLSATIFANVATLPKGSKSDAVVPKLQTRPFGEYPPNDLPVADMDSNGWPRTGRDKALEIIRKAFALHIAGDQHLASVIQYGVDDWNDAGYAFCVPSVSNIWPRRWFPKIPGANRRADDPKYVGNFEDGFGNKITVKAVANPVDTGKKPAMLYNRSPGFGIVRMDRKTRNITMECYPRYPDTMPTFNGQFYGWPVKINILDNYGRPFAFALPTVKVQGIENPVVRVLDESNGKMVYCLRVYGRAFALKVFKAGKYTVEISDPDAGRKKVLKNLEATKGKNKNALEVKFK
jgi:hypothetical protein